jgi:hypothetical protein
VQAASDFHHLIGKERLGIAKDIFDDAASLDIRNDVLDHNANAGDERVFRFLRCSQLAAFGLFLGLIDRHTRRMIPLKSGVLEQRDISRKHGLFEITYPFVMHAARISLTQIANQPVFNVGNQIIFQRMSFFSRCIAPSAP